MRCSMCGHESPAGSSFCLNCGSSLTPGPQVLAQTPPPAQGLPGISVCGVCRGENPPGMKFCRSCGSALAQASAGSPAFVGPMGRPGPMAVPAGPMGGPMGGPMPGMPSGPIGGFPSPPAGGVPPFGPIGGMPGQGAEPPDPHVPPSIGPSPSPVALGMMPTSLAAPALRPDAQGSTIACPRCGTQTPLGFAYCQQCGLHMQALQPTDPVAEARPRGPTAPPPVLGGARLDGPIDPHAGTIAQDNIPAGALGALMGGRAAAAAPRPQAGPGWGTAVLVNRDGSDGQRYPLAGEYLVIGRAGADIAFDDDRFLARQHARLERGGDGVVKVHPLDTLNGVFRKTDAPVELVDGMTILVGREVLRFERVDPEEIKLHPLVRHGVALFGSPPREPWGRFVQLVPSGGYRDVRHLAAEEIVLGREEGDIVFRDDAFMSRRHAAVTWDGKRSLITDLGSSNGTFIRVTGPTALKQGDHIRLGDQLLRIELGR
jgi:pSer/pThr/pTyr-binding forkhead associated (FHA) protein